MRKKTRAKTTPGTKAKTKTSSPSKFWFGLLVGGAIAAAAVHFGPGWLKEAGQEKETNVRPANAITKTKSAGRAQEDAIGPANPDAPSLARSAPPRLSPNSSHPRTTPPVPKAPGGLPFFRDPARAAYLLTRLDMGESYPGSLLWKKADALGWNAFGVLATPGPGMAGQGTTGNTVSCLLESKRADLVEALRLTANVFDSKGEAATMAKFKSFAQAVLQEARCPVTRQFLEAIDGTLGLQTESPEARFTLARTPLAPGTRWELTVESR